MTTSTKGRLRRAIENFFETYDLGTILHKWLETISGKIEGEALDLYEKVSIGLGVEKYLPEIFSVKGMRKGYTKSFAWMALLLPALGALIIAAVMAVVEPVRRVLSYQVDRVIESFRPDPATAWAMLRRDPSLTEWLENNMRELGLDEKQIIAYGLITEQLLPALNLESLRLRGLIPETDYAAEMSRQGFTPERIQQVQNLAKLIPNPQDLVNMAVREAWDAQTIERFQYMAGFPAEFSEWMQKQGYSEDWAKKFWTSHWVLPGLSQAYEMVHRLRPGTTDKPFTLDDMRLLLKTADYPEYFRDRLIEISYAPYTRIDVRRLFGQDILTEDQVYQNYLDLGYDVEHAKNLTAFTVKGARAEEKGLTREAITSLYRDAILGRPEAKTMLNDLGYNDDNAEFWLLLVDYALDAADDNAKLATIRDQFVSGDLDDSTVMAALGALNLAGDRQARLLTQWVIQRAAKVKKPSSAQLEIFYKAGLVQGDEYLAGLLRFGYNAADADLFVKQTDLEIQAAAVKEQERAQAASDKAAASTKASALTKALAVLDATIAEYRLEIANINVAMHQKPDEASAAILADNKDIATVAIAQAVLDKALLRV